MFFFAPEFFVAGLPGDSYLDGELFGGRKQFQITVGIVKSQDRGEAWKNLTYQVFDIPSLKNKPFEERLSHLNKILKGHPYASAVKQAKCQGNDSIAQELIKVEEAGGEGLMLRQPKSIYVGTRSSTLLKIKSFSDDEARIIGHTNGKGKFQGMLGALKVELANGMTFQVGSGLTDKERMNPPKIGEIITFKYQELTDGGVPRFPTFVGVRVDAKWPPEKKLKHLAAGE